MATDIRYPIVPASGYFANISEVGLVPGEPFFAVDKRAYYWINPLTPEAEPELMQPDGPSAIAKWIPGLEWRELTYRSATSTLFSSFSFLDLKFGNGVLMGISEDVIAVSSDGGETWGRINTGFEDLQCLCYMAGRWHLSTDGHGVAYSDDNGATWSASALTTTAFTSMAADQGSNDAIVGVYASVPYVFSLLLNQWVAQADTGFSLLGVHGANGITVAVGVGVIAKTTDGGSTWTTVATGVGTLRDVDYADGVWLAAGIGGLWRSTDDAATWAQVGISWGPPSAICHANGTWVAYSNVAGIYTSTDGGATWAQRSSTTIESYGMAYALGRFITSANNKPLVSGI